MTKLQVGQIQEHPHLISVAQAARILGINKVSVYYRIYEQQSLKLIYRVGGPRTEHTDPDIPAPPDGEEDERPFLLLNKAEVLAMAASDKEIPLRIRITLWNKRIKDWGRNNDFGVVHAQGRPNLELINAYLEANPEDTRPE